MESSTSSNLISDKVKAMQLRLNAIQQLEIGKSLAFSINDVSKAMVQALCECATVEGDKSFVFTKHETVFEVGRLANGFPTRLFYINKEDKNVVYDNNQVITSCVGKLTDFIEEFGSREVSEVNKIVPYTEEMRAARVVPYAAMQRSLVSVVPFKHYAKGGTEAVKLALRLLCEDGFVEQVETDEARSRFDVKAKLYRIL